MIATTLGTGDGAGTMMETDVTNTTDLGTGRVTSRVTGRVTDVTSTTGLGPGPGTGVTRGSGPGPGRGGGETPAGTDTETGPCPPGTGGRDIASVLLTLFVSIRCIISCSVE